MKVQLSERPLERWAWGVAAIITFLMVIVSYIAEVYGWLSDVEISHKVSKIFNVVCGIAGNGVSEP